MSLKHTIQLIIKAQDEASKQVKKVEDQVKKFSNSSKNSINQANKAFELNRKTINSLDVKLKQVGQNGKSSFDKLSKSQQDSLVKFNMLDKETQNLIKNMNNIKLMPGMVGAVEQAKSEFNALNNVTKTWSGSMDYAKSKLQLLGTNTDSFKGKIQVVGSAIQTYVGAKWDTINPKINMVKTRITGLAGIIKSSLGAALSYVGNRLQSLGQAFDGIGGMITQSLGVIGVNSIKEMTIEASISRDRIFNLSYALMGAGQSAKEFKKDSESLWNIMDRGTNNSLVGLDQLSQAMSVIKLSTGATTDQLKELEPTILDIGQRAILMGKDGEEAVSLMQAAGKGLNGEFEMLKENLGISKDKLIDAGWSGAANDIDGYTEALKKCLAESGDVSDMMGTTYGKLTSLQKFWKLAGRSLGDEFLPYIDQALDRFIKFADANQDGALDEGAKSWMKYAVGVGAVVSGFVSLAPTIVPVFSTFREVKGLLKDTAVFMGLIKGEETALTLATAMNTITTKLNTITHGEAAAAATAESLANASLTESFAALATATWSAMAPLLPYVAVIAAVGIAVYELGKYFGWWNDVGSMIDAISAGLNRLWSAFINNPDVQGFIKGMGDAWNSVTSAIGPVIGAVMDFFGVTVKSNEEFDIVRVIIDGVGAAFHKVANDVRTAIDIFKTIYGVFQGIYSFLQPYGEAIYNFLKPIVCILLGCSPGIVPALEKVQEVFQTVWSFIAGFIGSYVSTVISVISTVITTIQNIVNVFGLLLSGQISLGEAIPMIWNLISNAFTTIGGTILNFITKWAGQLLNLAIRAATNFMNGIVNRIRNLPGKVYGFITSTASRIREGAANWANNARTAATNTYNAVVNNITGLPGKVYQEFIGIGNKIKEAFAHVVQQASNFASGIKNKILDILGIHSPGILQEKIGIEFTNIGVKSIGEKAKMAYDNAKSFASNIISGFGSEDVTEALNIDSIGNMPSVAPSMSMTPTVGDIDTTQITEDVTAAYDNMNALVGVDLADLTSMNQSSFGQISANEQQTMKNIYNHVNSVLMNILKVNKSSLNSNASTTKRQLNNMKNSTKTVTAQMVEAWNGMKNSIVSAAQKINSDATSHFNKLGSTIGGFYGKLQNPSRWGTGPGPEEERRGTGRGVRASRLVNGGNAMRVMSKRLAGSTVAANNMPRTISVKSVQNNPTFKGLTDFISNGSTIDVRTLFETGVLSANNLGGLSRSAFGAWENTAKPNVDKIKRTVSKWSMKGPKIANRVSSGLTFRVSDFESGTPKIGINDFINMAYALVNSTSYGYYADSSRYGNWLNALNHGEMNCSDGSDMLIALARTCGLPAEKVHCYWGTNSGGIAGVAGKGEGHFVARIGGRIMDSVSMRHGSLTSPKVHGYGTGPSPSKSINDISNDSDNANGPDEVKVEFNDFTITQIHKFEGLPKGIDEATIARMINEAPENERFVKQLANNIKFQVADRRAKVRLERKSNRSKGLGA